MQTKNLVEKEGESTLDPDLTLGSSWRPASLWYQMMCVSGCAAETNGEAGLMPKSKGKILGQITCPYSIMPGRLSGLETTPPFGLKRPVVHSKSNHMSQASAGYEPVATTEDSSPPSPARSRKYRVIAVVLFVGILVGLASYKSGIWFVPSARVGSRPNPSAALTTPSESDNEEQNNKTGTETQAAMPHGKYSVG